MNYNNEKPDTWWTALVALVVLTVIAFLISEMGNESEQDWQYDFRDPIDCQIWGDC